MNIATRISLAIAAALTLTAISISAIIESSTTGVLSFLVDTFGVEVGLGIASNGSDFCFSWACVMFLVGMAIEAIVGGGSISSRNAARYF